LTRHTEGEIKTDVAIVCGGAAGLAAAQALARRGVKTVILERNICGGSSTAKSAGFLTPYSELELAQLLHRFGTDGARDLWEGDPPLQKEVPVHQRPGLHPVLAGPHRHDS